MIQFHYLSPSSNISFDVYRHTLFVSINSKLDGGNIEKTLAAYNDAKDILNRDYAYWGEIITVNTELILDMSVVEAGLAGAHDKNTAKRKCLAVTMLPNADHAEKTLERLSNFYNSVPVETFHTIPQAMHWIDDYMNFYASRELIRNVSDTN